MVNMAVATLIRSAYPSPTLELIGAPEWVLSERYDVTAKTPGNPTREEITVMLRTLLKPSAIVVTFAAVVGGAAVVAAQTPVDVPGFEVASVKPAESLRLSGAPIPRAQPGGRFAADFATVSSLLWFAYGVRHDLIIGGPDWVRQDPFQISAKAAHDAPAAEIKLMVQSLLKDRFKLIAHKERREMSVQALVRARPDGPLGPGLLRMEECSPAIVNERRRKFPEKYPTPMGRGKMSGCSSAGLGDLAILLSLGGTTVIDATGLTESFYYTLRSQFSPRPAALLGRPNTPDPNLPALSTALEEQLGLRLQSRRAPVEVLVVDSVERPTPD